MRSSMGLVSYSKAHTDGNVATMPSTTSTTVHVNTDPEVTSRDLQRACSTPHAISQAIVAARAARAHTA